MGERIEYRAEFDYSDMVRRISEQTSRLIDEQAVEQVRARLAELGYRKCSECKERQGYYLDAETIQRQQERIAELQAKVAYWVGQYDNALDERDARDGLIRDMMPFVCEDDGIEGIETRIRELGIEV